MTLNNYCFPQAIFRHTHLIGSSKHPDWPVMGALVGCTHVDDLTANQIELKFSAISGVGDTDDNQLAFVRFEIKSMIVRRKP
jgi:hypothetical protein